ncbi:MAG: methyltransferase domain-containing protein [Actinobacteria bacterium]|nr:methyltransferase domain-containing protein [Thermoleophilia bacterium]MCB9010877.1 methyltransferase domain-containing protein [Actinomycetota bacterium]
MPQARTVNRSHRPDIAVAAGWPLARRVGLDGLAPGGRLLSERLIRGAGIRTGDRVVDLLPGDGALGRLATRHDLHSWTGVCLDRTAAKHVRKRVAGGGTILGAPDRTGLDDGSATVVVAEGLLSGLSAPSKRAVLDEARRILRPGGRIGLHELAVTAPAWDEAPAAAVVANLSGHRDGSVHPLSDVEWRALIESAGLTVVGTSTAPLMIPTLRDLVDDRGPVAGLRAAIRMAIPGGPGARMRRAVEQLTRNRGRLTATVLIAERPLVGPLRSASANASTVASGDA